MYLLLYNGHMLYVLLCVTFTNSMICTRFIYCSIPRCVYYYYCLNLFYRVEGSSLKIKSIPIPTLVYGLLVRATLLLEIMRYSQDYKEEYTFLVVVEEYWRTTIFTVSLCTTLMYICKATVGYICTCICTYMHMYACIIL